MIVSVKTDNAIIPAEVVRIVPFFYKVKYPWYGKTIYKWIPIWNVYVDLE